MLGSPSGLAHHSLPWFLFATWGPPDAPQTHRKPIAAPFLAARTAWHCSPVISLAPRPAPLSPAASLESPSSGSGGLTLQQILQQYSSSGYSQLRPGAASRRSSLEAPRGEGGAIHRGSTFSQVSDVDDAWLGNN